MRLSRGRNYFTAACRVTGPEKIVLSGARGNSGPCVYDRELSGSYMKNKPIDEEESSVPRHIAELGHRLRPREDRSFLE